MAQRSSFYPKLMFNLLWLIQGICSLIILIFFYVTWAKVNGSPVLRADLTQDEFIPNPTEWKASWFLKLIHINAHISLVVTIGTYALNCFGRLYPPLSCFLNFACLIFYILGIAGTAAFGFLLHLMTECSSGLACTTFKIAFVTAHVGGTCSMAQIIFDGYAWGRMSLLSKASSYDEYENDGRITSRTENDKEMNVDVLPA